MTQLAVYIFLFLDTFPRRDRLINIIPKQSRTWELSFKLVLLKSIPQTGNIIHFTTGKNAQGARTPAIFTRDNNLLFRSVIDSSAKYFMYDHRISVNQTLNIKMRQVIIDRTNSSSVDIFIDQVKVFTRVHSWNILLENVRCYFGSPWYNPSPVRISNLRYTEKLLYPGKVFFRNQFLARFYLKFVDPFLFSRFNTCLFCLDDVIDNGTTCDG